MAESLIVGYLRAILSLDSAEYEAGVRKAADSMKALSKDFDKIGQQLTDVGKTFTAAFTVPIVGAFASASKAAIDFESSFAGVKKTVEATDAEFAVMSDSLRALAREIPVNVNELNQLAEAAGALGIPKEEIVDFARVMAELGVTTNLTSDQAAEAIAKIQNIFNAAGEQTENFASSLVALGNAGASTEVEILAMATRIAAAGNTIGLTQDEVLGLASAMASLGLEAEAGGTAMSRVFVDMAAAVSAGGVELQNFAAVAGMAGEQFASLFRSDASAAVLAFIEGLGRIKEEGGDVIKTLSDLGVQEVRLRDALLRLAGAGDQVRTALELSNEEWRKNTALSIEAEKRYEVTAEQLKVLWNQIKDVGITIGNALLPMIQATVQAFNSFIPLLESGANLFASLPMPIQVASVAFAGLVAAIGPALIIFGQMAIGASSIAAAFGTTGVATRALTLLMPALATSMTAVTTAVAGLGTALGISAGAASAMSMVMQGLGVVAAAAGTAFVGWNLGKWIGEVTGLTDAFARLVTWLGELVRLMPEGSSQALKSIQEIKEMTDLNNEARSRGHDITLKSESVEKQATATRQQFTLVTEEQTKAQEKAAKELKKMNDELIALDRSFGALQTNNAAIPSVFNELETKILDAAIASGKLHAELVKLENSGSGIPQSMSGVGSAVGEAEIKILEFRIAQEKLREEIDKRALQQLGSDFQSLAQIIGGEGGLMIANIGQITTGLLDISNASAKVAGNAGAVIQGFVNIAAATEGTSTASNVLGGALAGLAAGMNPGLIAATGGFSVAIGAAAGAVTGWIRASQAAREEAELLREQANDLADEWLRDVANAFRDSATAMELAAVQNNDLAAATLHLNDVLSELGLTSTEVAALMKQIELADTPEEVEAVLNRINALLDEHTQIMERWAGGVSLFVEGFTTRVDSLTISLADVRDATDDDAAAFDRMAQVAVDAFGIVLAQTGSALAAIEAIQAPLSQLIELQDRFGFETSDTFARLADISDIVSANEEVFRSIEGLQQMMLGLDRAMLLTADDFRLFGQDAVSLFNELIGNGVDANTAMALMQPTLQMLWELQKQFGVAVDDGTRALLEQAETAGLVGEEHRSINEQILNVLLQIEDAILRLPAALQQANNEANALLATLREIPGAAGPITAGQSPGGFLTADELRIVYGREPTDEEKRILNENYIKQGYQPPFPEVMHGGGMLRAHAGMFLGNELKPGEVPFIGLTGEAVLNRRAVSAFGGEAAINAFNQNPWGAQPRVGQIGVGTMGMGGGGDYSSSVTVGSISVTIQGTGNPEYDGRTLARVVLDELANGGDNASQYRRVHKQLVPA